MKKKPLFERVGDFMAGKGFYIVLFLCVAAIGISGYYLFSTLDLNGADAAVVNPTKVVVTQAPTAQPVKPTVAPTPRPTPKPTPAPTQTPAPAPAPAKASIYTWPVKGEVVGDFSLEVFGYDEVMGDWRVHTALDLAADVGAKVMAVTDGTVSALEQDDLMGTTLVIDHKDGLQSVYANLAALPTVEVGDSVTTGEVIGAVGQTAVAESNKASHLHFEMLQDGDPVDPANYLPK
ncbi:MAG: M23 family metallopeptidase [Clostridia bacterium]|nr:M23 family metallopeptidase [Clostridia bacterium]